MKYSLFGNDELGWTVADKETGMFVSFDPDYQPSARFGNPSMTNLIETADLTTKEKAEEKLKELQDEK